MKKLLSILLCITIIMINCGFTYEGTMDDGSSSFNIDDLYNYQKEFIGEEIGVCANNSSKTYMDYRATTARDSKQYWFIHDELTVDEKTGLLYDKDGFIGVALGSYYGEIGSRYYFTLDSGIVLPLVKCEQKADVDTDETGCYHISDNSVIEFVIDSVLAREYFGMLSNSYILNGNFNNYTLFNGSIVKVEKVTELKNDKYISFGMNEYRVDNHSNDIYYYGSGY